LWGRKKLQQRRGKPTDGKKNRKKGGGRAGTSGVEKKQTRAQTTKESEKGKRVRKGSQVVERKET